MKQLRIVFVFVMAFMLLVGCEKKIPEGISNEMYEVGQKAVKITEEFLDGDISRREAVDEITELGNMGLEICTEEKDDGTLDEKYYSDKLMEQTILLIANDMCMVDGEQEIESSLGILKEFFED